MNIPNRSPSTTSAINTMRPAAAATDAGVLISDAGFAALEHTPEVAPLSQWLEQPAQRAQCVALAPEDDPMQLVAALGSSCALAANVARSETAETAWQMLQLIVIEFPQFNDGRGFSSARLLRLLGYRGELRARGELLPDQYALLRRVGFDTVQISAARARRQPEAHWLSDRRRLQPDYQQRLGSRKQTF